VGAADVPPKRSVLPNPPPLPTTAVCPRRS